MSIPRAMLDNTYCVSSTQESLRVVEIEGKSYLETYTTYQYSDGRYKNVVCKRFALQEVPLTD